MENKFNLKRLIAHLFFITQIMFWLFRYVETDSFFNVILVFIFGFIYLLLLIIKLAFRNRVHSEELLTKSPTDKIAEREKALQDEQFLNWIKKRDFINAIKRYRELTGDGLMEAKAILDALVKKDFNS